MLTSLLPIITLLLILLTGGWLISQLQRQRRLQRYQLGLDAVRQLRQLITLFQRHRGLSNGVLCGDQSLSQDLATTRQELDRHIGKAQALASTHKDAWSGLIDHWSRMRDGRSSDPANNLAQHHLIIRNSIFLMEDVASEIDLSEGRAELGYLPCIWREVVQAAEWAGQARALGTGIAAAFTAGTAHGRRGDARSGRRPAARQPSGGERDDPPPRGRREGFVGRYGQGGRRPARR